MDSNAFLKLIGAPWAAFHDHPDANTAASLAEIRPMDSWGSIDVVARIGGCNWPEDGYSPTGATQRARRDLLANAWRLYGYAANMAATGDTEAKLILRQIHGDAS